MTEAELIEQHIAVNGVTRCPTRYAAETMAGPEEAKATSAARKFRTYRGGGKHCRSLKTMLEGARADRALTRR